MNPGNAVLSSYTTSESRATIPIELAADKNYTEITVSLGITLIDGSFVSIFSATKIFCRTSELFLQFTPTGIVSDEFYQGITWKSYLPQTLDLISLRLTLYDPQYYISPSFNCDFLTERKIPSCSIDFRNIFLGDYVIPVQLKLIFGQTVRVNTGVSYSIDGKKTNNFFLN